MHYIYKFINKINGHLYIGQTNNIEARKRNHKSDSFNINSNGYNLPFHAAVRKYGWENFNFEIIEEIDDAFGQEYIDERERYFIQINNSLVKNGCGYNLALGGMGCSKEKLTFEEQVKLSKLFTIDEVKDIQQMLIDGYQYFEIRCKYPRLSDSFISNINTGQNFIRDDLEYPLSKLHTKFTKETQNKIIDEIRNGVEYKVISNKYGISTGYISMINSGKKWHNNLLNYPLCKKSCSDGAWSNNLKKDLIFTSISHYDLAAKYNKAKSTITAINVGRNRKDSRFLYPLRQYQNENKIIWNTLF